MENNRFIQIKSADGEFHYVNHSHIIDITDIVKIPDEAPTYCQVYLTHGKSFTSFEPAISIIERIYLQNGKSENFTNNTK